MAFGLHHRLHGVAVRHGASARRRPDAVEQSAHRLRRLRHGVVETEFRKCLIAEEPRALDAQLHHLGDDRLVVGRAAAVAARDPGAERFLPQVAARRKLQERLDARTPERDDMLALEPALLGVGAQRRTQEVRQPGEVSFGFEDERVTLLIRQHVLAEASCRASPAAR